MDVFRVTAALLFVVISAAHSFLGEKLLIGPMLSLDHLETRLPKAFSGRTLRFAWHLTSLAWVALGAVVLVASDPLTMIVVSVAALATALVIAFASRGAHFAWAVFLAIGVVLGVPEASELTRAIVRSASGWIVATTLILLALMHAYWAFGGRTGFDGAIPKDGGKPVFLPGPALTLTVSIALLIGAMVALNSSSAFVLIETMRLDWLALVMATVFGIRAIGDFRYVGFFKRRMQGTFARMDSRWYVPLCVGLCGFSALTAL